MAYHICPTITTAFDRPNWKCNNDLLRDNTYRDIMKNLIETEEPKIEARDSLKDWWDVLKIKIANVSKRYQIKRNL